MLGERRIGLVRECGRDNFLYAGFARYVGEFSRINAVARDDSENFWILHCA
jgi:hypothetical protein